MASKLQYSSRILYDIQSSMTDFHIEPELLNRCKETGIVCKRRGTRAGLQIRIKQTKTCNFSYPYGLCANVNSLQGKYTNLHQTSANIPNLTFIALQETKVQSCDKVWLNETPQHVMADEALNLDNFYMFRHDRQFAANGGGLITYVSKQWTTSKPKVYETISTPDIELLAISIRPRFLPSGITNITIVNVYTRPSAHFKTADSKLKNVLTGIERDNPRSHIILMGDFNRERIAFVETMGFQNIVNFITYPSSQSKLDAVYVKGNYYTAKQMQPIATSDHYSILVTPIFTEKHRGPHIKKTKIEKDLSVDHINNLREMLNNTDWDVFRDSSGSLDEFTEVVSSYVKFSSDICVPNKTIPIRDIMFRIPANDEIKQLERDKKQAIEENNRALRNSLQRRINNLVYNIRSNSLGQLCLNSNSLWTTLKSIRKPDVSNAHIDEELGGQLCDHFGRFNNLHVKDITLNLPKVETPFPGTVNDSDVKTLFNKVKTGIACGVDGIPWWVFKNCSTELAGLFASIFQDSFHKCEVPSFWKNAITAPIPKITSPNSVNDYRPIDLTSIPFNCMQKFILPCLESYIDVIGDKCQFAYRKGVSCTDAVLTLVHNIVSGLNSNDTSISKVLYLDFSSAFNTVLPNYLIQDVCKVVDEPWLINWLAEFVKGWSRQVKQKSGLSERCDIKIGVPQGGPLSALLFTIYTDEIRSNPNCLVVKYADDTAIACSISKSTFNEDETSYQESVQNVVNQCDRKNLLLNPMKSKEMVFHNINVKHEGLKWSKAQSVNIKSSPVDRVSDIIYLGVCIDDKLNFTKHISRLLRKVYYTVSCLSYIVPFFNKVMRDRVFNALILPQLLYAVPVWYHFLLEKDKQRMRKFLKYTAKIFKLDYNTLMMAVNNSAYKDFVRLATNVKNDDRHPLNDHLAKHLVTTKYNLRNPILTPRYRINLYKNSFIYRAAIYFQSQSLGTLL